MKDPVSCRFVLPLTRLEQVAHNGYGSGITQTLRRLHGLCETGHLMATGHEDLDQLGANESGGSCDKGGRSRVACHVASLEGRRAGDHRQHPHRTRTTPVQARQ